jgi:hypothetical protein
MKHLMISSEAATGVSEVTSRDANCASAGWCLYGQAFWVTLGTLVILAAGSV